MGDFVFNVAKGRVNELVNRVANNDPANSAIIIVAINTSETDGNLQDLDTLAAVLANGNTAELGNTGYARVVYTDSDLSTVTPDDTGNQQEADIPDIEFGAITDDDVDFTDLLVCYDSDTTSGDDSNIVPLTCHDFPIEVDGSEVIATINADGFFRAS